MPDYSHQCSHTTPGIQQSRNDLHNSPLETVTRILALDSDFLPQSVVAGDFDHTALSSSKVGEGNPVICRRAEFEIKWRA